MNFLGTIQSMGKVSEEKMESIVCEQRPGVCGIEEVLPYTEGTQE